MKKFTHLLISFAIGLSLIVFTSEELFATQTKVYVHVSGSLSKNSSVKATGGDLGGRTCYFAPCGSMYFSFLTSGKRYTITVSNSKGKTSRSVYIPYKFATVVDINL